MMENGNVHRAIATVEKCTGTAAFFCLKPSLEASRPFSFISFCLNEKADIKHVIYPLLRSPIVFKTRQKTGRVGKDRLLLRKLDDQRMKGKRI